MRHVLPTLFPSSNAIFHPVPKEGVKDKVQELEEQWERVTVLLKSTV